MSIQGTKRMRPNFIRQGVWAALGAALLAILPITAHADTVPAQQQTYGPPYTVFPHFPVPPENTIQDEYNILLVLYKQFYGSITAQCGYPLTIFPTPQSNGAVAAVQYTSPCSGGNYIFGTATPGGCPPGYTPDQPPPNTISCSRPDVSIFAGQSLILSGSSVDENNHVLTSADLSLTVTKAGQPAPGTAVTLQSDRGQQDTIDGPGVADSGGYAGATVSTRNQPGTSTITSATSTVNTLQPGVINWFPATYWDKFEVTCYGVAQEAQDINGSMITIPGIPGTHHQQFLSDTKRQGSGLLLQGGFMQRNWLPPGGYVINQCPETSDGSCAVAGQTAAVDGDVIPSGSSFSIDTVGTRTAQDTGGAINGDHIDVFFGTTAQNYSDCLVFGTTDGHTVQLLSYGN